jgi:hypothetical protein
MLHNDAATVFGSCACACHRFRAAAAWCWCKPERVALPTPELPADELDALRRQVTQAGLWLDAPPVAHNDAVHHFGSCRCACHRSRAARCWCSQGTDPQVAQALQRKESRDLHKRLMTGRARPEEYLRHAPHLLPGLMRRSPGR